MAGHMKNVVMLLCGLAAGAAAAETGSLTDPTRPTGTLPAGTPTAEGSEGGWRLQSVLSPRGGRPTAIINGQVVRLGDKVGEARLVRLNEKEAVLKGPKGVERLALVPDVSVSIKSESLNAVATGSEKRKKP